MPSFPTRAPARLLALSVALLGLIGPRAAAQESLRSVIDAELRAAWQREKLTPAPRCDDSAFLRRVTLDLVGSVPTYDETRTFLADTDPGKRTKLVDRLLADPRFGPHQADVWDLAFFGRNPPGGDATRRRTSFKTWLATQFAKDVPYDRWARAMLLARDEGTELYYVQYRGQPEDAAVGVSRTFLGTQLQCARCHDHPYEIWTQKDFYGLAGFFVRLVVLEPSGKGKRYRVAEKTTGEVLFSGSVKEQRPGRKGEPVRAKYLGGKVLDEPPVPKGFKEPDLRKAKEPPAPLFSRKEKLAEWVTAANNPYFARAAANRVWAQFMGRGLVHPIDDLSEKNIPSHPKLLDALQRHLIATRFDLKGLIREVVNSEAYQLACTGPNAEALPHWYDRARVRPLSAEELIASIKTATQYPTNVKGSGDSTEYFLRYFGEPNDGQGRFQGSLAEHLFLNNASNLRTFIQPRKGNLAESLLKGPGTPEAKVERLFLSVLCRPPSAAERQRFVRHLTSDPRQAPALVEEAIWVLLSCSEFRFNH